MKIHSDILTPNAIYGCIPDGCYLAEFFSNRTGGYFTIEPEPSRSRAQGFKVRLSGSSRYVMVNLDAKAATWDEWGIFIDNLFTLDPNALIGHYPTRENFMEQTRNERDRIAEHRSDLAATHSAPWVTA